MSHSHSTLEPPRRLLFGPGPTQVHPRVYEAMGKPIVGHLDPFFSKSTKKSAATSAPSSAPKTPSYK